jgi:hypothetical protein
MGIREYARHRNVSHVAVLKALRTGRIRQTTEGLIDSGQADLDWLRNTHPAPRAQRAVTAVAHPRGGYSEARTVREHYLARLARLAYDERLSTLVRADEVRIAESRVFQALRQRMLTIPGAVACEIAAGSDPGRVYELLCFEIRGALVAFANDQIGGAIQ